MRPWKSWRSSPRKAEEQHPWTGMTNADLLTAWDAGRQIWTCQMADFGPAYEQCIHGVGMEVLRGMLVTPFDFAAFAQQVDQAKFEFWQDYARRIFEIPEVAEEVTRLAPEGLQMSAAMNLAGMFVRNGYEVEMDRLPESRRILMSKSGPQAGQAENSAGS